MRGRPIKTNFGSCLVEDCGLIATSKGYCSKHFQRWRKYGDPSIVKKRGGLTGRSKQPCTIEDCDNLAHAKTLCKSHYYKAREKLPKKESMNAKKPSHLKLVPKETALPPLPLKFMTHPTFGKGLIVKDEGETMLIKFSDGTQRRIYKQYLYPCKGKD